MLEINRTLNTTKPKRQGIALENRLGSVIRYGSLRTTQPGGLDWCFLQGEICHKAQERLPLEVPAIQITSF